MTYPGARAVSMLAPGDRQRSRRFPDGPRAIDSASDSPSDSSDSAPGASRGYARHARSMSARRLRQRVLALALAGAVVAVVTALAAPRAVRMLTRTNPDPSQRAAVAARHAAVSWITRWVSGSATISCDPLMCTDLREHGIASIRLARIRVDVPDPEGSDVVVATEDIRNRYGRRLAGVYAPAVLASFGRGQARIDVRVVPNAGATVRYRRALRENERFRRWAGRALLGNRRVTESEAAAKLLAGGSVDARILATLALVARICPVTVLKFGGAAPGASPGMPMLSIDLTAANSAGDSAVSEGYARVETPGPLAMIKALLAAQVPPLRAASFRARTSPEGMEYLHIVFAAPTVVWFNGSP